MPTHQELDQRSLAMHRLVAEKIRADTSLIVEAEAVLKRWYQTVSPRTFVYLDAWQRLLLSGVEPCLAVATEDSERAAALRQASPLACLLSNQERFAFLKEWRLRHATQ
jgi:hypothetical protein